MSYDAPPPPPPPYGQPPTGDGYGFNPSGGDALRGATIQQAVERFFKKYAIFTGRASRSEFWYWVLVSAVVGIVLSLLGRVAGIFSIIGYLWDLATLVPSFAVGARRLHDTGRSGWWQLLLLIPCVGAIILIVWWATGPKPQGDKYNNV